MKMSILGSGSSGNSIFVETGSFRFLIDAGFSGKKIEEKLNNIGIAPATIGAILITHEHTDHIQGAGVLSRKYNVPIYITKESFNCGKEKMGNLKEENIKFITRDFIIGNEINIKPFEVLHDAEMTIGYRIEKKDKKIAIATDIGYITNIVRENFKESDIVVIESNYDYEMLMNGNYPWELKNRVKGRNGHLSNVESAKFLKSIYSKKMKKVYLAHISKDNNRYELAYKTSKEYLEENEIILDIEVAEQEICTKIFEI